MAKFGPGTLTIGETGTSVDCSCLVNSMQITTNVDEGDDSTKLRGTVVPGTRTYTYTLTGNVDTDEEAGAAGLFALSQDAAGTEQAFTFTPNTADGTTASGKVIINPLDFGSDGAYGDVMASDLEWKLVGKPEYVYGTGGAVLEADEAELVGAA
jgi:hypothetical protein